MTRHRKIAIWAVVVVAAAGTLAAVVITVRSRSSQLNFITGAVLRQEADPRKQRPIGSARITASGGLAAVATSDSSGFFRLLVSPKIRPGQPLTVSFRHPDYQPLDVTQRLGDQVCIARMVPLRRDSAPPPDRPAVVVANARVRYAMKSTTTMTLGSSMKTFEVVNKGNIPCAGQRPCSPDGRWKASIGSTSLDAGDGNEFRNVRVSCIAGPCPFTKIESDGYSRGGRAINVSVRNWSDTVSYLMEAEVTHTMVSDMIRRSYPAIAGQAMNFTLPATAQGPSIEAEINGTDIVFPLGPKLALSWANCNLSVAVDRTKAYRCELKSGFRFQ
jgi:hypothetical protein